MSESGRCLCGSVTFDANDVTTDYHSCHCATCQRWSGGSAHGVQVGSIAFSGEDNISRYESSDWAERGFCKKCGGHLFYYLKPSQMYLVWAGFFDDQSTLNMVGEIFVDEKPPGYSFAGDHERLTGAEFMARINADA